MDIVRGGAPDEDEVFGKAADLSVFELLDEGSRGVVIGVWEVVVIEGEVTLVEPDAGGAEVGAGVVVEAVEVDSATMATAFVACSTERLVGTLVDDAAAEGLTCC